MNGGLAHEVLGLLRRAEITPNTNVVPSIENRTGRFVDFAGLPGNDPHEPRDN